MKSKIFLISDLHLDHYNIIKYCNRPFSSVREMNFFIVNNWNTIVKNNDIVYFLGDMSFGSHDKCKNIKFFNEYIMEYNNIKFLLIHDPDNLTKNWNGWIIHGHYHNHDLENYPFINGEKRRINVSIELINYKPLDIEKLFAMDFKNIKIMEKLD